MARDRALGKLMVQHWLLSNWLSLGLDVEQILKSLSLVSRETEKDKLLAEADPSQAGLVIHLQLPGIALSKLCLNTPFSFPLQSK